MHLEKQVCSLELAKKLKELGVKQESYFEWINKRKGGTYYIVSPTQPFRNDVYSAFTVAELGEMLPNDSFLGELVCLTPEKTIVGNWRVDLDDEGMLCCEKNEADARAKMLIYLLENKLIQPL